MISKNDLLKLYRKVKESTQSFDKPIPRDVFRLEVKASEPSIRKEFGTYANFVKEAEELYLSKLPQSERALLSERSKKFDPTATKDDCINDLRELQKKYPTKHLTRNFYREHGSYSDSTWNPIFGNFTEFRRQAGLELTRHQHKLEKEIAKHASHDHYTEYYNREVAPFYMKYEKVHMPSVIKRMLIISDIHDIEASEFTVEVFIAECKRKQPDIIVFNGDIFDLYEFSRYTQDPRHIKITERFNYVHEIFRRVREACPDAQIDFVIGNHEFRLIKHLADATPNLRVLLSEVVGLTLEKIFGLDKFQINLVSKFNLKAFTKKDIGDQLKQNFRLYFNAFVVTHEPDETLARSYSGTNGHHHSASYESRYNIHVGCTSWTQTGAAHERDAEYLSRVSKWNKGFLEVIINTELRQVIQRLHQTHDTWTEIDGVYYESKI